MFDERIQTLTGHFLSVRTPHPPKLVTDARDALPDDMYISERVTRLVKKSDVTIGIIAEAYPTPLWHVGSLGVVR